VKKNKKCLQKREPEVSEYLIKKSSRRTKQTERQNVAVVVTKLKVVLDSLMGCDLGNICAKAE
jgi:hypothetical protein